PGVARRIVPRRQNWSPQATLPTAAEVAELRDDLRPATQVYLSAVPTRDPMTQIAPAVRLAAAGLVPVPHVAVRNFASVAALEAFLSRMVGDAGVRRLLAIAADRDAPGPSRDALEAIRAGLLHR